MRQLIFNHKYGWVTKITYRKTCNDLIVRQYNKDRKELREIYLYDDDNRDLVKELTQFLVEVQNDISGKKQGVLYDMHEET